jgi:microcystin-dependent protein
MADAFLGEIRIFAGNFAPSGWAMCDGMLLPLAQNTALFSLLGTQYGGNGQTNFALPDLRAATPLHAGGGAGPGLTARYVGERGGARTVTLLTAEIPAHNHVPQAVAARGNRATPTGALWAQPGVGRLPEKAYTTASPDTTMRPDLLGVAGESQPHNNLPPYLALTFVICLNGIFPSRP